MGGAKSQGLGLVKFEVDEAKSFFFEPKEVIDKGKVINKDKVLEWIEVFWKQVSVNQEIMEKIMEWLKDEYSIK